MPSQPDCGLALLNSASGGPCRAQQGKECGTNQQAADSKQQAGAIVIAVICKETLLFKSEIRDSKS